MATLVLRTSSKILTSTGVKLTTVRSVSTSTPLMKKIKWVMSDPTFHATGAEKYELLAKQAGNDDPFFENGVKRGKGTKDEPNIINALDSFRMVGCVCNENDTHVNWFWLIEGKPKRCGCGYWFKLKQHPPIELTPGA